MMKYKLVSCIAVLVLCFALLPGRFPVYASEPVQVRLGYCESDPYVEFDTQLYYLILGMEEYGLLTQASELLNREMTAKEIWSAMSSINAPEWKVHFAGDMFVSLSDSQFSDQPEKKIDRMIAQNQVDLLLTFGTNGGLTAADLESGIPQMNFVSADPCKTGIVRQTETSGIKNRWAHIDVDAFNRTIKVMADIFSPGSVGVVYSDNDDAYVYSGADVLDEFCRDNGITVYREFVKDSFDASDHQTYLQQMRKAHEKLADKIYLYVMTTSLLEPDEYAYALEPMLEKKIPIYSINSSHDVECGALMAAEPFDFPNIGRFGADILKRYLEGEPLESLPQIYQTAPFLVINYSTARKIGYRPSFDMLLSASYIYSDFLG